MERNKLRQLCQELEKAFDDENMERLGFRIEDLKRLVETLGATDETFTARKGFLELTTPLREFPSDFSEQLAAESEGGFTRDQEKTVMNYETYMSILCEDLAVNLRNMVVSIINDAVRKHRDSFRSETDANNFTDALISMVNTLGNKEE